MSDRSSRFVQGFAAIAGLVALLAMPPAATADPSGVALNEVNCKSTGPDWVEVINNSNAEVSIANWLLTDDPLDAVPLRDDHRMRFGNDAVLAPGAYLVITQGVGGFPFDLSCGGSTLRLADATNTLVESVTLPSQTTSGMTYGRIPDGTGTWTWTLPTQGMANAIAPDKQTADPAWLYDPLQVTEIDLAATPAALSQLDASPDEYVEARIILRNGTTMYGPYRVGLKLKGHATFRTLAGKAAFKVKFSYVSGQRFRGLKALTLNNMVQDPSMIAEATSALLFAANGVPSARVGYAYVRLNGADYGLYADVETVDSVMAKRFFTSTQHIYKADYTNDVIPGRTGEFEVEEGSSTDRSDLEALAANDAGGTGSWSERLQPVADLTEITRAMADEHYAGHWDSYSVGGLPDMPPAQPNNYYLHSNLAGSFSLITSGTDQTWLEHSPFGVYGDGVLMRHCVADGACRELYIDALRQLAGSPMLATLADRARAIRAVIAPWRASDPRREQTVAEGEAQADAKIATMAARPAELAAWLAHPSFAELVRPIQSAPGGSSDLMVTGTVAPALSPVGGSHVWRLQVTNSGNATAVEVALDVRLSANVAYGFGEVARGAGCVPADGGVHCGLAEVGPSGADTSTIEVVIGTNVTGVGEVSLTATASFAGSDQTPADNTLVLKANSQTAAPPEVVPRTPLALPLVMRPLLGKPVVAPVKPVAGRQFTFSLPVTRSDNDKLLLTGKMVCDPSVAGKVIRHTESFKAGKARLSFIVPKTAKGKLLKVKIAVKASGQTAGHTYTYTVR